MASTISTSTSTSTWLPGQSPVHVPEIDIAISPLTGGDTDFDALLASFSEGGKGSSGNQCLQQQQHVDVLTSGGDGGEEAALKASARDFDHFFGQMNTDDADADAVKQQQQHRKPTAAPTTMTGQKRSAAAAAEEEAVTAPAPAPAGRQPRRAATRAALALEAAMSPSSLADEMDEDGNHADEHEEEDAASDNGSDYDEDDDASVSASATRASAQRRNRTNTASSAAAAKKSGRTSTGGSTSRRSAGGRDSGSSSMNDPNRNARLAKENRERKKQYIAGLEATIEELRAQCRQHEQKQAELRRQADLVSAENATLRTTLAHQQAFAPIVAAMQAVPGLSFTAPAVAADANSSNNKRPRVGTSATTATPTVVPLTFNVYLNPAANQ